MTGFVQSQPQQNFKLQPPLVNDVRMPNSSQGLSMNFQPVPSQPDINGIVSDSSMSNTMHKVSLILLHRRVLQQFYTAAEVTFESVNEKFKVIEEIAL